jgi:glucan 1,3-beta-glucosidase
MGLFAAEFKVDNNDYKREHYRGHAVIGNDDIPPLPSSPKNATTTTTPTTMDTTSPIIPSDKPWVRGVNLGGWLMLERYITPYTFAVTDCHLRGDFCWYPGQINAPPPSDGDDQDDDDDDRLCDLYTCKPMLKDNVLGQVDFPMDEYHLWAAFLDYHQADVVDVTDNKNKQQSNKNKGIAIAEQWLQYHLDNFMNEEDIRFLAQSGVTHIRVPLPHWILQNQTDILNNGDVWIVGQRWQAFQRLVLWSRKYKIQVWPDIHTAPGSQNGFDNSGIQFKDITGTHWSSNPAFVQESLDVIAQVTLRIVQDDMQDVVTGFGLLNEPFKDTNRIVYLDFIEAGLKIVRTTLANDTYVYVSDLFSPQTFNNGHWWMDAERHDRTFLDTRKLIDQYFRLLLLWRAEMHSTSLSHSIRVTFSLTI